VDNPAVQTAVGPMVIVAMDQTEPYPLVHDEWAGRILPPTANALLAFGRSSRPARGSSPTGTSRPSARELPVSEIERSVTAEKI
jgi:O-methyltransferase involved in polyketide biosynthesis